MFGVNANQDRPAKAGVIIGPIRMAEAKEGGFTTIGRIARPMVGAAFNRKLCRFDIGLFAGHKVFDQQVAEIMLQLAAGIQLTGFIINENGAVAIDNHHIRPGDTTGFNGFEVFADNGVHNAHVEEVNPDADHFPRSVFYRC